MTFSVVLGWWLVPVVVSLLVFVAAWVKQDRSHAGDYGSAGQAIGNALLFGLALIVALLVWLIWALLT